MTIDSKTLLKILEAVDPSEFSNTLAIFMMVKSEISKAFETHTYYDASGLVVELVPKGKAKGRYKMLIRPMGDK